ncbi:hypothetical protein [Micromonospora sediminimaris]|uniref:CARDB protein n=1 Tax=Micromonospora sediminimaris TaxID=547162 RepID=A0A9W5XHU3_9ACTN|nr:hypothetical protein [Micromonospora sediminimaris]GIJ31506.1 hypothetical protein Vse01_06540 [Micromonospora sediminimaris]SFC38172.1 hypothetical protein SAMN05216284_104139 [Micromonospora sediminimaris]
MSSVGRRLRRAVWVGFVGAALTGLLTTGAAAAVPVGHGSDRATPVARTDVHIRDVAADTGVQPHSLDPLWASPDIKVCPTAVECAVSQNPVVGATNYIFVKLRNPGPSGSGSVNGVLQVYRTTPGGGAVWPIHWTRIGAASVAAAPGVTTVTIPWKGVPGPGHFCLLARWVSNSDPMTVEGPDISTNTRSNNNLAWRNVDSVQLTPGAGPTVRPFAIGNSLTVPSRNEVLFVAAEPLQNIGGRVIVDLGQDLFERWRAGGAVGTGVRPIGRTQVEIVDTTWASLGNLLLQPGERAQFSLIFTAQAESDGEMCLAVVQLGPDSSGTMSDLGGVQYLITSLKE